MIEGIRQLLSGDFFSDPGSAVRASLEVALAALLVEAANADRHFDEAERATICRLLERRFRLSRDQARELFAEGAREADRSVEIFHLTRTLSERLSPAERVELIEMLWEVAYADGGLDKYEDSLLRRVGGLIDVSDRERGLARRRVLRRLGIGEAAG